MSIDLNAAKKQFEEHFGGAAEAAMRAPGRVDASLLASTPIRTISSSPTTPTAMFPLIMKAIPPNIFCSVKPGRSPILARTSSAIASLYAMR